MPKVLCTLPNASDEISGVKFVTHAAGMLSEDVTDEVAAGFTAIPGYELVGSTPAPDGSALAAAQAAADAAEKKAAEEHAAAEEAAKAAAAEKAVADEKIALLSRASEIGFRTKANWSLDRLRAEVEGAEKADADAKAAAEKAAAEKPAADAAETPAA